MLRYFMIGLEAILAIISNYDSMMSLLKCHFIKRSSVLIILRNKHFQIF